MFIPGSGDIGFLCSNMRIEANNSSYNIELKNKHFDTHIERHEEKSNFEEGVDKSATMNENVPRWLV